MHFFMLCEHQMNKQSPHDSYKLYTNASSKSSPQQPNIDVVLCAHIITNGLDKESP